ncbi:DUF4185 domain-containing protein [Spirochaetota bacterium]
MSLNSKHLISLYLIIIFIIPTCSSQEKVSNLGIFGRSRLKSVIGQDGCTSIEIDKNTMMWTFGDTLTGDWKGVVTVDSTFEKVTNMKGMISNSLAFTNMPDDKNINNLKFIFSKENNKVTQFIKNKPGENPFMYKFWAVDGIKIGNIVYVYYMIVRIQMNNKLVPFKVTGMGIGKLNIHKKHRKKMPLKFIRIGKLFKSGMPTFGDSVIRHNGYIYLAGHGKSKKKVYAYISRVKPSGLIKRKAYEFLENGGKWSGKFNKRDGFFGDVAGELSISYNKFLKSYIIIYCSLLGKIKLVKFKNFKDLKKAETKIIYVPKKLKKIKNRPFLLYYSGKEIFHTKEAIYAIYIHPAIYQPILIKIPYVSLN